MGSGEYGKEYEKCRFLYNVRNSELYIEWKKEEKKGEPLIEIKEKYDLTWNERYLMKIFCDEKKHTAKAIAKEIYGECGFYGLKKVRLIISRLNYKLKRGKIYEISNEKVDKIIESVGIGMYRITAPIWITN